MPSNSTITVLDGKASPASHVFTPIRIIGNVATYRDLSMSPAGVADTVIYSVADKAKIRQVKVSLMRPRAVTETVNGVVNTRMADYDAIGGTINVPLTWAEADIKDTRVMFGNLLVNALILAGIDTGAFVY